MKTIKIGNLKVSLCQHKGDLPYERFVKFKQYAPQFWEKMDSPLFESYWERFMDHYNKAEFMQAGLIMRDYKLAIDNAKNSFDAWGVCFVLITEVDKKNFDRCPDDEDVKRTLELYNKEGLMSDMVAESVLAFMKASPETFTDHLTHYALQSMMSGMQE